MAASSSAQGPSYVHALDLVPALGREIVSGVDDRINSRKEDLPEVVVPAENRGFERAARPRAHVERSMQGGASRDSRRLP